MTIPTLSPLLCILRNERWAELLGTRKRGKCLVMTKTELRYNQITREPQRVGLTSKVCKPLYVRRCWLCALHIISGNIRKITNQTSQLYLPVRYMAPINAVQHPSFPLPLKKKRTNQPPNFSCNWIEKGLKQFSDWVWHFCQSYSISTELLVFAPVRKTLPLCLFYHVSI